MKNKILLYAISEGLSRGVPQLILVVLAFIIPKEQFATLILIYGLESLLVLLLPSNYVEILYSLQNNINQKKIRNTIFSVGIIVAIFLLLLCVLAKDRLSYFYGYDSLLVFICIILSAFINSFMRFYRSQLQILLEHANALKNMLYSFGFANIWTVLFLIFFDDKIFAFFGGKAFGLVSYMIYLIYKDEIKIYISKTIVMYFLSRLKFLFIFAIYSWVFGYGFIYIVKIIGNLDDVANIGYIVTFSTPFSLLANAINQVYNPKIKQLLSVDFLKALSFSRKIMFLYIAISLALLLAAYLITFVDLKIVNKYGVILLISVIVFIISTYRYVYEIYIYINDLFKNYVFGAFLVESLSLLCIIFIYEKYTINIIYLYPALFFARNICVFYLILYIKRLKIESC